jgi:hypothetical protein
LDVGTSFSNPITDMSYSLISTDIGGKVLLRWKYRETSDYYIKIIIPEEYSIDYINSDQEYQPLSLYEGNSILAKKLQPESGSNYVSYTIPSDLSDDILSSNAQKYMKSGRGYQISISPVEIIFVNNSNLQQIAPSRNIYSDDTFIIPFRKPNRPLSFSSQGYDSSIILKWILPNFNDDPNFYITYISTTPYYRYKFFTLDRRDIGSSNPLLREWRTISNEMVIPTPENGGVAGYQQVYTVSDVTNEQPIEFRIRTVIVNEYNGQHAYSDYKYMTNINNIEVPELSINNVYPSKYPYKPSIPFLRFASRTNINNGINNGLTIMFDYPNYNGNADFYECDVYYNKVGVASPAWSQIFDENNGIADLSNNIILNGSLFTTNRKLKTTTASITGNQSITILCKGKVLNYEIRIRVYPRKNGLDTGTNGFYLYGDTLYSDYSNIDYIES